MDNPVSWLVLLCLAVILALYLAHRAFEEMDERNNYEWDDKW